MPVSTLRILTICAVIYVAFLVSTVLLPPHVPGPPAAPSQRTTLTRISENGFGYVEKNKTFRTIEGLVVYEDDVPLGRLCQASPRSIG